MSTFHEYLRARLEAGGFSTEDALGSFLPLARQVLEAHAAGRVAPLEGVDALHVDGVRIWFEEARRQEPRNNAAALRRVEASGPLAVTVVAEARRTTEVDEGDGHATDLSIGDRSAEMTRPVYLPGYVAWEHQLGHHDPLTDVFGLGMLLASLACGLDFADPEQLSRFVVHRRNLFSLSPGLHPVLAQAISRMTEIDRHRRVQDLRALVHSLEDYRDQEVDFDVDLARIPGFVEKDDHSKQHVVLSKLRERLFEISRRNRLLHFRPTMQTVNLTHASVPLSFDITSIRPDQVLVWNESLRAALAGGEPVSLNKYLNFAEALYLPSMLDRIMAESRRDRAEFGFGQLRLVICFLHWANLKEKPVERFDSPLVLLPVELKKKKGIRDTYHLEAVSPEAEVNPVVRHEFKQLYDIDLPEVIDLSATSLDQFFAYLAQKIAASEPAVSLVKIDRPRIELIHDKARRKLDRYRRRARLAGRGIRSFQDFDYSYDQANYHPLGITLFSAKIRAPATHLRTVIEEKPRPRSFAAPEPEAPAAEKERLLYHLQEGGEENPYVWNFDLCSVTLGNFKYRKMSLVRDYETLLDGPHVNPAFDAVFSLAPRAAGRPLPAAVPLEDRFHVVPSDPTQATAIDEARAGTSYIIQGPPGTGKSQTITNLIADYVARGKRVLFACEKRAAIDVVIFDEASQITLEEAVPAVFRAPQVIVVGDEMQLPPTDFFSARRTPDEEEELLIEEGGEVVQYDLASNSFLNPAAKNLPSTMLGWHYRSRSESLVSFSNWAFYDGRLLTVPEERLPSPGRQPIVIAQPPEAERGAEELLDRAISFHHLQRGVYDKRRNRSEADYIAQLVRELLRRRCGRSIGIVAFSEAQQDEIEGALERLAQRDADFRDRLDAEWEREIDGQFVGLLVKNLENIQGDERDIIVLSVCYGYGPNGKMLMNFGPINKSGGERRLNVAFSRAKHHMAVVSSIQFGDITNDYNEGAACLKNYLRYAEAVSAGNGETSRRVLHGMSRWQATSEDPGAEPGDPLAEQIAAALAQRGHVIDRAVGQSHFRCDLAVRRDGDATYRLAILLDNDGYYDQSDLLERDLMRPKLLRDFGWNVTFVLAKDWYEDRDAVLDRIDRLLAGDEGPDGAEDEDEEPADGADDDDEPTSVESAADPPALSAVEPEPAAAVSEALPESPGAGEERDAEPSASLDEASGHNTRRFEFARGSSNKFWEITLTGSQHTVRFGRIGTKGQTVTKTFQTATAARRDCERLIRSKLAKGYEEK